MTTNTPGDSARLFPRHTTHYFVRGGPNDPVLATAEAAGTLPATLGTFSFNSKFTAPPNPGTQTPPAVPAPRPMTINLTVANTGGIFIGTIPQGAWIHAVQFWVYTAFTGGAGQSIGVGYTRTDADITYGTTAFTGILGAINGSGAGTGPVAGLFGGEKPTITAQNSAGDGYAANTSQAYNFGPGNGVTGSAIQLASLGDINLYVFTGGALTGTLGTASVATAAAFTAGCAAVRISYTGLEG